MKVIFDAIGFTFSFNKLFITPQQNCNTYIYTCIMKKLIYEQKCHSSFFDNEMFTKIDLVDSYSCTYIKRDIPDLFVTSSYI